MPIPLLIEEIVEAESSPAEVVREGKLLQFPAGRRAVGAEDARMLLRDRVLAHAVDAVLVHGFSLYFAKVAAFLMALALVGDVQSIGREKATQLFQSLVTFGTMRAWIVCFAFFSCLYVTMATHYFGRTFGKAIFRLKVVAADGARPDLRQSFRRYLSYCVTYASFGLTFLLAMLNSERRMMHDRVSETDVVRS
jgi:uncharacterized RDD family membrane protein YckC